MDVFRRSRSRTSAASAACGRRALARALASAPTQASYAELLAISSRS